MNTKIVGGAALAGIIGLFAYKYLKAEGGEDVDEPMLEAFKPRATSEPGMGFVLPQEPNVTFPAPAALGTWFTDPSGNVFWQKGAGSESYLDVPTKKQLMMAGADIPEEDGGVTIAGAFLSEAVKGKAIGKSQTYGKIVTGMQTGEYTPKAIAESKTYGKIAQAAIGGGYAPKGLEGGKAYETGRAIMSLFGGKETTGPGVQPTGPATPVTSETVYSAPRSKKEASSSQQSAAMSYSMSRATGGASTQGGLTAKGQATQAAVAARSKKEANIAS